MTLTLTARPIIIGEQGPHPQLVDMGLGLLGTWPWTSESQLHGHAFFNLPITTTRCLSSLSTADEQRQCYSQRAESSSNRATVPGKENKVCDYCMVYGTRGRNPTRVSKPLTVSLRSRSSKLTLSTINNTRTDSFRDEVSELFRNGLMTPSNLDMV